MSKLSNLYLNLRSKQYSFNNINKISESKLIYQFKIPVINLIKLKNSCLNFIKKNFILHDSKNRKLSILFMLKSLDTLSTYTHNGVLKPKLETILIYSNICKNIINYLEKITEIKNIKSITFPNVRIIRKNKKLLKRKYSNYDTRVLHSDLWVGQKGSGIFNLGIYGDFKKSSVNYFDILNFKKKYLKKQNNFLKAQKYITKKKYFTSLKKGRAVFFDMSIPHQTFSKYNGNERISLDFCINVMKNSIKKKDYIYYNYKKFKKKIHSNKLSCKSSILDAKNKRYFLNDGLFFKR